MKDFDTGLTLTHALIPLTSCICRVLFSLSFIDGKAYAGSRLSGHFGRPFRLLFKRTFRILVKASAPVKHAPFSGKPLICAYRRRSGSNDANAEFMAKLRRIMDDNKVCWQTAELGRVDLGGGGTIAYICALYGMEVIDSGVAVLSMHAPMEIISKADLYESYKAYKAFMLNA